MLTHHDLHLWMKGMLSTKQMQLMLTKSNYESRGKNDSSGLESDIEPSPELSEFGDSNEDATPTEIIFRAIKM